MKKTGIASRSPSKTAREQIPGVTVLQKRLQHTERVQILKPDSTVAYTRPDWFSFNSIRSI